MPLSPGYYSQFGEDRILSRLFPGLRGICVDVGAHDGVHLSNSYRFEQLGWRCILVEPTPHLCRQIRVSRPGATLFECAASDSDGMATLHFAEGADVYSSLESETNCLNTIGKEAVVMREIPVRTRRLDDILIEAGVSSRIHFISIDVEGHELAVIRGFSLERWQPEIAVIEDSAGDISNTPVHQHMRQHGYVRFYRTEVNDWYAGPDRKELHSPVTLLRGGGWGLKGLAKAWLPVPVRRTLLSLNRLVLH